MRHARWDKDEVTCNGGQIVLEFLAIPHLNLTSEDIHGRLMVLM